MKTIKVIALQSTLLLVAVLLTACAGKFQSVYVTKTLPGQEKVVKAYATMNYDTVQGKSVSYQVDSGASTTAPNADIQTVGGGKRTYSYQIPGSGAWQPGQVLNYTWQINFNRAGQKTQSGTLTVPGVPDLIIPPQGISFSVGGAEVPGNPGSVNPDQQPAISTGQNFTVKVVVRNQNNTVMPEPFVVKLYISNETSGQLVEDLEATVQGVPVGQDGAAYFGYKFDTPATLLFAAEADANHELPETNENNNTSFGIARVRIVQ